MTEEFGNDIDNFVLKLRDRRVNGQFIGVIIANCNNRIKRPITFFFLSIHNTTTGPRRCLFVRVSLHEWWQNHCAFEFYYTNNNLRACSFESHYVIITKSPARYCLRATRRSCYHSCAEPILLTTSWRILLKICSLLVLYFILFQLHIINSAFIHRSSVKTRVLFDGNLSRKATIYTHIAHSIHI